MNDLLVLLAYAGIFISGMLGFMYITANKKPVANQQTEKIITVTKDSFQTAKDSIKLFK